MLRVIMATHNLTGRFTVYYFRSGKGSRHSIGKIRTFRTYLQISPHKYALMPSSPYFVIPVLELNSVLD